MSWPTVTPQELADRWRTLTSAEETVAAKRIEDAEAELREKLRLRGLSAPPSNLDAQATLDWEQTYIRTVTEMVRRYMLNPDGWLQERVELDDFSRDRRRDSAVSSGLLYVTDDEVTRLVPTTRRRSSSFTIRLGST